MHNSTYYSLVKWYKKEIEKFGWMIIFKEEFKDNTKYDSFCKYKITLYIYNIF